MEESDNQPEELSEEQIAKNWRAAQPRCNQCKHLASLHGEDGCKTILLGIAAVPYYSCACTCTKIVPGNQVNPVSDYLNLSNNPEMFNKTIPAVQRIIPPNGFNNITNTGGTYTTPPYGNDINRMPYVSGLNINPQLSNRAYHPFDFYSNYEIFSWRQATSMLFGRIQNNMIKSKKALTKEEEDELVHLAMHLRNKMNEYFTDEGIQ